MTQIIDTISAWKHIRQTTIFSNKTLGLVPTMGNLHAGHESLLARSVQENTLTILTLFVNPTQFDNADDLKHYPRTLAADIALAEKIGVDFILIPKEEALYADGYKYRVSENRLSLQWCGKHRPGHFDGVLTIVLKLLNLIKPQRAYFGEKDFQQLQLVKSMVEAFFIDTQIIECPIVRDEHGLALSSRNRRLTKAQYEKALIFPKLLSSNNSCAVIAEKLEFLGFRVDYIEEYQGRRLGAVWVDNIRLIDNVFKGEE
jgi:pantoate--beta-alanine ligase